MQVINNLDFQLKHTAVCIGKFDGLHRGHRLLLSAAAEGEFTVAMITFIFPGSRGIYTYQEKLFLAEQLGVEVFIAIPVTEEFMHMSAEEFVREILVKKCDSAKVIVGADFGFGYQRSGNVSFLQEAGERYGFETLVFEKLMEHGEVISSTRIRGLLKKGDLREVNDLLDTPYFIQGIVEKGNRIGRTMGVPTANIKPDAAKELPPFGVYTVRVMIQEQYFEGVGNLGVKPTIADHNEVTLEIWLFDFQGDLYGKTLTVYLLDFQRTERKFESLSDLKEQIERDVKRARKFFVGGFC